jgi:hypothetical protein
LAVVSKSFSNAASLKSPPLPGLLAALGRQLRQ